MATTTNYTLLGRGLLPSGMPARTVVYDSGDDFELITSQDSVIGAIFNTTDDELEFKIGLTTRAGTRDGPTGMIEGRMYAFILLERSRMWCMTSQSRFPVFVQYVNNRSTTDETEGDLARRGPFIPATESLAVSLSYL